MSNAEREGARKKKSTPGQSLSRATWSQRGQNFSRPRRIFFSALRDVAVSSLVVDERVVARREEVVLLVRLAHEVEVVHLRGVRGGLHRRETGVRDRRRRQARVVARVVRAVALQLRLEDRLRPRDAEAVTERRVDAER